MRSIYSLPMSAIALIWRNFSILRYGIYSFRKAKSCILAFFLLAFFSSLNALASNVFEVRLTWDSGAQRTDLDLSVVNSQGQVVDYARRTSTWGATHTRDDMGVAYQNSYESFSIDIGVMDCLGGDYSFYVSHYSGPSISSIVSASQNGTKVGSLYLYTNPNDKILAFTYTAIPQNCVSNQSSNILDFRKSTWNQPRLRYQENQYYYVGCTSVAVGTLIDYYLKSGYADGWLDHALSGVTVYPRFQIGNIFMPMPFTHSGFYTANGYNATNDNQVDDFLKQISFGLDSQFLTSELADGGAIYFIEPEGASNWSDKIATLLRDRFRFNAVPYYPTSNQNLKNVYKTLLKSQGKPIILKLTLVKDGNPQVLAGHAVVMDGYREVQGHPEFRMNFGWGTGNRCSEQWVSFEETNRINMQCDGRFDYAVIDGMVVATPIR